MNQPQHIQAPAHLQAIEKEIAKQAGASLIWGIVGLIIFGIVLGPFAIYRGAKARRLIRAHNVGHQHDGKALAGFIIGIVDVVGWLILIVTQFS